MKKIDIKRLIDTAISAREHSYSPYSGFKVGSAVLTSDNEIFVGCNIESISYSPTVCAERVAIFNAISSGKTEFKAIAVATGDTNPSSPCGVCRQVMSEFVKGDFIIIMTNIKGDVIHKTLDEIFPMRFSPSVAIGKDHMWELLEDVIFKDDVMSTDEMAIVKNVMSNIDEFEKFLKYAEKDGHISNSEKFIIEKFRERVYSDAFDIASKDNIITEEEGALLHRLAEILRLQIN